LFVLLVKIYSNPKTKVYEIIKKETKIRKEVSFFQLTVCCQSNSKYKCEKCRVVQDIANPAVVGNNIGEGKKLTKSKKES